ncbi:hypothetical protein [Anaerobium acetethylicum]|uniref:Uncharacterized protein n=1 Tax=Anaerobium acetethylicum TaxID=1619234 RepID=A0A1D3TUN9_9FIRM|nr:hypothetical protein [Anaerobium acetethylicum]SCP97798.1 hypothetical protein SAMN05421730_10145 [Anaerobium acetethylicum]
MKNIWWNQVTNAVQYVSQITQSILDEKSILIRYTSCMPWYAELESSIIEAVKQQSSEKKFVKTPAATDPGAYLLREFCKPEKRATYRPTKGYPKFFAESDDIVLHDRYLWVQIDDVNCLENWLAFVSEYVKERGKNKNTAVFILEWAGDEQASVKKGIKIFSLDDFIGDYDRIVFAVLASSSIRESAFIKKYIAELVANVAGNDIELCAECIQNHKPFLENPLAFIRMTVEEKERSDGTCFRYTKTSEEVEHFIWLAQIKTIYPHLEEYREEFVQKHSRAISKQLPISASYGEIYNDPKDVELGTLKYMADNGCLTLSTSEYENLKKYKDARNKLSHLAALSINEIKDMLK